MTENERQEVIKRIKEDLAEGELCDIKRKELKVLEQDANVRRYKELKKEVESLSKTLLFGGDKTNTIFAEFLRVCTIDNADLRVSPCPHSFYVYTGSFSDKPAFPEASMSDYLEHLRVKDEKDSDFSFNSYECLLCGKAIQKSKEGDAWKLFENSKEHIVLKNKALNPAIASTYYRRLYYSYLFDADSIETADELLICKYYDDLENQTKRLVPSEQTSSSNQ